MKKITKRLLALGVVLLLAASTVFASTGSWNSTYTITNHNGRGILTSREFNVGANRNVSVTIVPHRDAGGTLHMQLRRRDFARWTVVATNQFHRTHASTRTFRASNAGTHHLHMWIQNGTHLGISSGNIRVSW